jgi:Homeodomain-like domain
MGKKISLKSDASAQTKPTFTININPGLLVVAVEPTVPIDLVRAALLQEAFRGGDQLGVKFPEVSTVRTWHTGGENQKQYEEKLANFHRPPPKGVKHQIRCVEAFRKFSWVSDAGWMATSKCLTRKKTEKDQREWNVFCENNFSVTDPLAYRMLDKLQQTAKNAGDYVMVILQDNNGSRKDYLNSALLDASDEFLLVRSCDPDVEGTDVFSFALPKLGVRNRLGFGEVMCTLAFRNEKAAITYEPFVHSGLRYRLAWKLRSAGKSYSEIAKLFDGVNKSTVKRWLDVMPPAQPGKLTKAEIDDALAMIKALDEVDLGDEPHAQKSSDDTKSNQASGDDDDDDDFEDDDEEDDEDAFDEEVDNDDSASGDKRAKAKKSLR